MGGKHDHRRPLTDCTVRSHIVLVLTPKFDLCPGVVKVQEPARTGGIDKPLSDGWIPY
jgi:hypothetical protein